MSVVKVIFGISARSTARRRRSRRCSASWRSDTRRCVSATKPSDGYGLYRQICALGHDCTIVAPSLIPRRPGERIKTNRRDAVTLARLFGAGELTPVWVPDVVHEAVRDLVRAREAASRDLRKKRQQLLSFLLRHGRIFTGRKHWSAGPSALARHRRKFPGRRSGERRRGGAGCGPARLFVSWRRPARFHRAAEPGIGAGPRRQEPRAEAWRAWSGSGNLFVPSRRQRSSA